MPEGFLIDRGHYTDIQRVVRAEHSRQGRRPQRRRQQVFQPGSGSIVYQCVYGLRLRQGTAADEEETDKREPCVLCVNIGDVAASGLRNLKYSQVRQIRDAISSSGIIDASGMILQDAVDDFKDNGTVSNVTKEQFGDPRSVVCLRARFAPEYIGTGSVVIGGGDEVWYGGAAFRTAVIESSIEDDDTSGLYLAKLAINQAAIDEQTTSEDNLIEDWIVLLDEIAAGAEMLDGWEIGVEFNPQPWFDNDSAYEPVYWYNTDEHGRLPVFNVVSRPMSFASKSDGAITAPNSGTFSLWTGDESASLTDSEEDLTAYVRYGDIGTGKWTGLTAYKHGWEGVISQCPS